jgi:hypothetical protein
MISDIGPGASAVELTRSLQGLADILKNANEQTMALSEKLLKVQVQAKVQDSALGTKIDTQA